MLISSTALAQGVSYYALKHCPLVPHHLYRTLTPGIVSDSITNNEIKGPSVRTFQNSAYQAWLDFLHLHSMSGPRLWLQVFQKIRDVGNYPLYLIQNWDLFFKIMSKSFPFLKIAEMEIPILMAYGNTTKTRMVTLSEYNQLFPDRNPVRFIRDIIQIVLFGFIVDITTIQALRIEDEIGFYLNERLAGGKFFSSSKFRAVTRVVNKRSGQVLQTHSSKRARY